MHNYVDIGVLRINIAISQGTSATRDVVVDSSSGKVRNGGVTRPGTEPFRKVDISAPRNSILFRLENVSKTFTVPSRRITFFERIYLVSSFLI